LADPTNGTQNLLLQRMAHTPAPASSAAPVDHTDVIEKLGAFYLGLNAEQSPVVIDSRTLTTHGVCIGMTGSGKTGMCIGLLEEAAIDGIPAIVIDPKGDLSNLALRFPQLRGADFQPYVDAGEAQRQGKSIEEFAEQQATAWRDGLHATAQSAARIERYVHAADVCVYTPGSQAGMPLSMMKSLRAPSAERMNDGDAFRQHINSTTQALLSLCAIESDPVQGREHILLSKILEHAASRGEDLALADLVRRVLKPPFAEVGVLDVESFFPEKERRGFALAFNNLLASPGFAAWMQGDAFDIPSLLFSPTGKPRISVLSIAHLNDAERMFVVSLVLSELVGWMRQQPGTSTLRAMLFVDEVVGYLPPVRNPPSKALFMTLFKQARAFGLGVVVATQNPGDIDYKALSNAGTWLIGRLQTDRDRQKVLDGIEGTAGASKDGHFDRKQLDQRIMTLAKRQFVLHSAHGGTPAQVFSSRCTLSYLAGPLTPTQLKQLKPATSQASAQAASSSTVASNSTASQGDLWWPKRNAEARTHKAGQLVRLQLQFSGATSGIRGLSHDEDRLFLVVNEDERTATRVDARMQAQEVPQPLPSDISLPGSLPVALQPGAARKAWQERSLTLPADMTSLTLLRSKTFDVLAKPGESVTDFAARVRLVVREQQQSKRDELKKKYDKQYQALATKVDRVKAKVMSLQSKAKSAQTDAMLSTGTTLLGAIFGKTFGVRSAQRAVSTAKKVSKVSAKREELETAEHELAALQEEQQALEQQLSVEAGYASGDVDVALEEIVLAAKSIKVVDVQSLWVPCDADGRVLT
jgi:hypothetical protein